MGFSSFFLASFFVHTARRRAAAKRKKLRNLGKSKSTDTEEDDPDDDCGDDGELLFVFWDCSGLGMNLRVERYEMHLNRTNGNFLFAIVGSSDSH